MRFRPLLIGALFLFLAGNGYGEHSVVLDNVEKNGWRTCKSSIECSAVLTPCMDADAINTNNLKDYYDWQKLEQTRVNCVHANLDSKKLKAMVKRKELIVECRENRCSVSSGKLSK